MAASDELTELARLVTSCNGASQLEAHVFS